MENKTENFFAIKFSNGHYWGGVDGFVLQLRKATLYVTESQANETLPKCLEKIRKRFHNETITAKIVEVVLFEKV